MTEFHKQKRPETQMTLAIRALTLPSRFSRIFSSARKRSQIGASEDYAAHGDACQS